MNEGRLNDGPIAGSYGILNEGRLNDGQEQMIMGAPLSETDMMVDDGPTQAPMDRPMDEERVGHELREGLAPQEAERLVGGTYLPRTVVIELMNHGYVVKLDCHKFAFESVDRALKYITEYLKDPQGTEEKWWKKELFK